MLTVIVGFDGSGNSSTCRPLASRYSVMPSTEAPCGNAGRQGGLGDRGDDAKCGSYEEPEGSVGMGPEA